MRHVADRLGCSKWISKDGGCFSDYSDIGRCGRLERRGMLDITTWRVPRWKCYSFGTFSGSMQVRRSCYCPASHRRMVQVWLNLPEFGLVGVAVRIVTAKFRFDEDTERCPLRPRFRFLWKVVRAPLAMMMMCFCASSSRSHYFVPRQKTLVASCAVWANR